MRFTGRAVATIALIVGALTIAAPAGAATKPSKAPSITITSPNVFGGFDRSIAAAHGYQIRTDALGVEYSVKIGSPVGGVQPLSTGTSYGDCGYSFVTLSPETDRMASGFVVEGAVAWRKWGVTVQNGGIVYNFNMDGGATGGAWSDYRTIAWASGSTSAAVNAGSYAALWDGRICYSGLPTTRTWM